MNLRTDLNEKTKIEHEHGLENKVILLDLLEKILKMKIHKRVFFTEIFKCFSAHFFLKLYSLESRTENE